MLTITILIIAGISIIWALISLKNVQKLHEVTEVKKELTKGKVIFHSDAVQSEE